MNEKQINVIGNKDVLLQKENCISDTSSNAGSELMELLELLLKNKEADAFVTGYIAALAAGGNESLVPREIHKATLEYLKIKEACLCKRKQ